MNIFYSPNISGDHFTLEENDSKHAIKVLRKKLGDQIIVVDGKGGWYEGIITHDHPKKCEINITNYLPEFEKQDFHLHVAIAPIKSMDRFEIFLEKATEIGISEISIIQTDHTIRNKIKDDRILKILVAGMKQSLKAYLPKLNTFQTFDDFLSKKHPGQLLIAHCEDYPKESIKVKYQAGSDVTVMIGPEGDFSPKEIESAIKNGFEGISLGQTRLRNETAGIVCVHSFHLINND